MKMLSNEITGNNRFDIFRMEKLSQLKNKYWSNAWSFHRIWNRLLTWKPLLNEAIAFHFFWICKSRSFLSLSFFHRANASWVTPPLREQLNIFYWINILAKVNIYLSNKEWALFQYTFISIYLGETKLS